MIYSGWHKYVPFGLSYKQTQVFVRSNAKITKNYDNRSKYV